MAAINLPIIDISNPHDLSMGKAMLDAAAKYGFLYVASQSTEFSAQDVERAFGLSKDFFASPVEEKATCRITPSNRGWSGMHVETLDPEHQRTGDFKEGMNFGEFTAGKAPQPLPPSLSPHEATLDHFSTLCRKTCDQILTLLALGLEVDPTFFTTRHDPIHGPSGCTLRFLYYPSLTSPATASYKHDEDVRAGAHSDYGSITLLFQRPGQPGLEILTPEGEWAGVPVEPNQSSQGQGQGFAFPPILVNIGDLLSYWTDGLLKSTVHRVVFPLSEQRAENENEQNRYSIVYFCHPVNTTELVPVPSTIVDAHREERKESQDDKVGFGGGAGYLVPGKWALTASEHLQARLAATYTY
ncbi:putative oxidoreductase, 2OG-Fe(II) oxygenase family [Aspergillus glaucus CBS 516.65]|uniref:Fe2OG dioxygenase domain-containing protein n=1 Tax=Aspergillus glaucus CBS 516.65 TaxID=1160497 RepID=A0A1L9VBR9_ASPGL|nr:hypothetical protein ASPGLDRAFT_665531 [Aspergillus glaucus CBS 516.65]OJJ81381.1 hypothetical protein ASPGLDRAFT_665531 [Aspergillus glaucus CBS 516.65]